MKGIWAIIGFLGCVCLLHSCGNIIPPGGGPRDTLPPVLIQAFPNDSCLEFNSKKIKLVFNEYIQVADLQKELLISPNVATVPNIEGKLKEVTIELKDSLPPNTTFTLQFGNAIKDVNENNAATNFTYTFSTGKYLDSNTLSGTVLLAETGKADTTLVALLHSNLSDSAILKLRPDYVAKVNNKGYFSFKNLPNKAFKIYVLPNDYNKRYDDSAKLIAFTDTVYNASSNAANVQLLACELIKKKKGDAAPTTVTAKTSTYNSSGNKAPKPEKLKLSLNLSGNQIDVLDTLKITANKPLKVMDSSKILLTDTVFKPIKNAQIRAVGSQQWHVLNNFKVGEQYKLIIYKEAAEDSSGGTLAKTDTLSLQAKPESAYGSLVLRFNKIDTSNTTVLQLVQQDEVVKAIVINKPTIKYTLFQPGDYELRILTDTNKNGKWDTGNYYKKLLPEKVVSYPQKLSVVANYDNEANISL